MKKEYDFNNLDTLRERADSALADHINVNIRKDELVALLDEIERLRAVYEAALAFVNCARDARIAIIEWRGLKSAVDVSRRKEHSNG